MGLAIYSTASDGWTVFSLAGDLDITTAWQLRDLTNESISAGDRDLVIDLNAVEFIDSTGLGVLIGTQARARRASGSLRLACAIPRTLRLFKLTGLTDVLEIHANTAAALRSPRPPSQR